MRAVLMERGKLWVDEVATPTPGVGEVLVKTRACGICGSDLHAAAHTTDFVNTSRETGGAFKLTTFNPVVLGHEFCAEVEEFGPQTERQLKPAQLVCSVPMLVGEPPKAIGYNDEIPGGFGEYMVLSERLLMPVPTGTPANAATLTEPLAVGLHAVNKARLQGDEAALVIGAGPVGLAVITVLNARGCGPIIATDYSPGRRQFALGQGADIVCDPAVDNAYRSPASKDKKMVIFECVGVPGIIDEMFVQAPRNSQIVIVGVCLQTDHIRPLVAINKELSLQFVLGYSMEEFATSLRHIADGKFDVAGMISHEIGLHEVAAAFEALRDPERYAKVLVNPWQR